MNLNLSPRTLALVAVLAAGLAAVSAPAQSTNGTDFASFQLISQRNIFDPNRVPHRPFASRAAPQVVDTFSFVGTMSYAKGTFAFFDGTSPDFRKVLEVGGAVAGFKLIAFTPKTATLVAGTNQVVLQMGMAMRRDDNGNWAPSDQPASYDSTGSSYASSSGGRSSYRRRYTGYRQNYSTTTLPTTAAADNTPANGSNFADAGMDTNAPDASAPPDTSAPPDNGGNDPLSRLMRQRALEQQQLGQGQ